MPQFSDLSDRQLHDIARYIHYARQQGRYKEIVEADERAGDPVAGTLVLPSELRLMPRRRSERDRQEV